MAEAVAEGLALGPGGVLWDLTLGDGGHAAMLLAKAEGSRLVGLDRDPEALEAAGPALAPFEGRTRLVHGRFGDLAALSVDWPRPDAVLMDLGTSTRQILDPRRGFSFSGDGPLDMRMDPTRGDSAEDLVNHASQEALEAVFRELGEERFAGRIARAVVRSRPLRTTGELARVVADAVPGRGRIHPATRVFQAIRIRVNDELGELARGLEAALGLLPPGARLGVLAFHSLEDRIVKEAFRARGRQAGWALLTRKAVQASREEEVANPRSRSARLRVIRREAA